MKIMAVAEAVVATMVAAAVPIAKVVPVCGDAKGRRFCIGLDCGQFAMPMPGQPICKKPLNPLWGRIARMVLA